MAKKCPNCGINIAGKKTVCCVCGKVFYGIRGAIYCSLKCKQKGFRKRKGNGKV